MTLKAIIMADMKSAMKAKNSEKLEIVRLLRAAIQRKELDDRTELDDQGVLQVVQKMIKQSKDAADQFVKGGREDLAKKESGAIVYLQAYLPGQLSEEEIHTLVAQAIDATSATNIKDMGAVMSILKPQLLGKADMAMVSRKIKAQLA